MKSIPYGWLTWAAVNAAATAGTTVGHTSGPAAFAVGTVALATNTRALADLNALYGPSVAVCGPALATGASYVGGGHTAVSVAVSVGLMALSRSAAHRGVVS